MVAVLLGGVLCIIVCAVTFGGILLLEMLK